MRKFIVLCLLGGCSVQIDDKRIDPVVVEKILQQHSTVISAIVEQIGVLQEKGILEKPVAKKDTK